MSVLDDARGSADDAAAPLILTRPCQHTPGRTTLSQRWGTLTLTTDRVRFVRDNGQDALDAPLSEVHSAANWLGRGLLLYADADRWKFDFSHESPIDELQARTAANSPVLAAMGAPSWSSSDADTGWRPRPGPESSRPAPAARRRRDCGCGASSVPTNGGST